MINLGATIFPIDAATTVIDGISSAITDNIGVVLAVFAFTAGVSWALRMLRKSAKGRV